MSRYFDQTVYLTDGMQIKEMPYSEYLETYWSDETTTPEGVANRTQVRAIILDRDNNLLDYSRNDGDLSPEFYSRDEETDEDGVIIKPAYTPEIKYGLFTWSGARGNGPFKWDKCIYDTEYEAYTEILKGFESDFQTKSTNAPQCFFSIEEAQDCVAERIGKPYEVIERFLRIKDAAKAAQSKRQSEAKEADNARINTIAPEYAKMITAQDGESYKQTAARLSAAIGEKIEGRVFHAAVKLIRSRKDL